MSKSFWKGYYLNIQDIFAYKLELKNSDLTKVVKNCYHLRIPTQFLIHLSTPFWYPEILIIFDLLNKNVCNLNCELSELLAVL